MATKIIFQLKQTSSPHLYIDKIKELIKDDRILRPEMKKALLLMKKTRMPYLILATLKEVILIPEFNCHLERALQPQLSGFARTTWSQEEIEKYEISPTVFVGEVFDIYNKLGYEIVKQEKISKAEIDRLIKLTEPKK